ncbi:MAG: invasin domain 3-containing protein [Gemmatimonadota bacterium]|nr:invasin domain 3-containing protein [Gemmatimonadota bacterium]
MTFTTSDEPTSPTAAFATITADPTEVEADGDAASTITVQLYEADETPLTEGGDEVTLSTDLGELTAVTDNADGTYTAELRSAEEGTATVTGTSNGEPIDDQAAVTFTTTGDPTSPTAAFATITAEPIEVEADGDAASTITVQLYEADETPLTEGGDEVTLSTDLGELTAVTDNADGTYTAELRSAEEGTATVTGTLNGEPIDDQAAVTFTTVAPVIASVEVSPELDTLHALGSTLQFTAVARDADGAEISDVTFTWSVEAESVAVIDTDTGVATSVENGETTVTATADGVSGTASLTVDQRVATLNLTKECVGGLETCNPSPPSTTRSRSWPTRATRTGIRSTRRTSFGRAATPRWRRWTTPGWSPRSGTGPRRSARRPTTPRPRSTSRFSRK